MRCSSAATSVAQSPKRAYRKPARLPVIENGFHVGGLRVVFRVKLVENDFQLGCGGEERGLTADASERRGGATYALVDGVSVRIDAGRRSRWRATTLGSNCDEVDDRSQRVWVAALTAGHSWAERAFTVIVCTTCRADSAVSVLDELRPTVKRCPHGVLVSTGCMLGPLACGVRPMGHGATVIVQPCTIDRLPDGPPQWIGPVNDACDAAELRGWLERGEWDIALLPDRMRRHCDWVTTPRRTN